jgi:hypothetical protein
MKITLTYRRARVLEASGHMPAELMRMCVPSEFLDATAAP